MKDGPDVKGRIVGLDSIRFICAFWVLIGHLGMFPLWAAIDRSTPIGLFLNRIYGLTMCAPAAVIVFFVISGFCIHYPFRHGERVRLANFYLRRYLRIGLPLAVALLIASYFHVQYSLFEESILWSLICEEIYYALYPLLMRIKQHTGWRTSLCLSFFLSFLVVFTNTRALDYPTYGNALNWLLGLPCWLMGCKLAESADALLTESPVDNRTIWNWRLSVWLVSCVCLTLRFHSPIGYPWTLNFSAIVVFFWLAREIPFSQAHKPLPILEWGGSWSYSLYLMHPIVIVALQSLPLPNLGYMINWTITLGLTLCGCYLFYAVIEKPSHVLARRFRLL